MTTKNTTQEDSFINALQLLGTEILTGYKGEIEQATEGLVTVTNLLSENPHLLRKFSNPKNKPVFEELTKHFSSNKLNSFADFIVVAPKIVTLFKQLKD